MILENNNNINAEDEGNEGLRNLVTRLQEELEQLRAPKPPKKRSNDSSYTKVV